MNRSSPGCIAIYWVALKYDLRFPLHEVILEILNKYELAPTQIVPTSWHNICFFIVTCELTKLAGIVRAFQLVHMVQKAPSEAGETS